MATYDINYDDRRFVDVKNEEATALKETKGTYDNMINSSDSYYQEMIDQSKEWANKQSELQQAQTDFTIEKVEQAKEQAKKDYLKEQKASYQDYQEVINPYGVTTEKLAEQRLHQSGYSKSVTINAYNTYQNRYMAARESYNQAILNYDNNIKEAQLANNSALATIAYEALQKQLELSLQGFQYKNTLLLQKLDAVNQTKDRYYNRYQDVLKQINTENSMAEQVRQYNESLAFQKQQAAQEQANWEKEYALAKYSTYSSGSSGGSGGGSGGSSGGNSGSGSKNLKEGSTEKKETGSQSINSDKKTNSTAEKTSDVFKNAANNVRNSIQNFVSGKSNETTSSANVSKTKTNLIKQVSIIAHGSGKNKTQAVEALLASAIAQGTIKESEARAILKSVGM